MFCTCVLKGIREQLGMSYVATSFVSVIAVLLIFLHWVTYVYYQVCAFSTHTSLHRLVF